MRKGGLKSAKTILENYLIYHFETKYNIIGITACDPIYKFKVVSDDDNIQELSFNVNVIRRSVTLQKNI